MWKWPCSFYTVNKKSVLTNISGNMIISWILNISEGSILVSKIVYFNNSFKGVYFSWKSLKVCGSFKIQTPSVLLSERFVPIEQMICDQITVYTWISPDSTEWTSLRIFYSFVDSTSNLLILKNLLGFQEWLQDLFLCLMFSINSSTRPIMK